MIGLAVGMFAELVFVIIHDQFNSRVLFRKGVEEKRDQLLES
jgi:hypothetical protein